MMFVSFKNVTEIRIAVMWSENNVEFDDILNFFQVFGKANNCVEVGLKLFRANLIPSNSATQFRLIALI